MTKMSLGNEAKLLNGDKTSGGFDSCYRGVEHIVGTGLMAAAVSRKFPDAYSSVSVG